MGKSPCCEKVGLKKGTWTPEEDQKLVSYIEQHGHGSWRALPAKAGLKRCGKSCRLRWINYLRPDIKRGKFSMKEEQTIIQLHALLGNRWSAIAAHLPKRTDNEIKNYWNTHVKKKLTNMGIDPATHKLKTNVLGSGQHKDTASLVHMAQWESARLEAESRLSRESKLLSSTPYNSHLGPPTSAQVPLNKAIVSPLVAQLEPMVSPCLDILKAWQGTWTINSNANGFFLTFHGSHQSVNSTLHFSNNIITMSRAAGLIGENEKPPFSSTVNCVARIMTESGTNNWKNFGKPDNHDLPDVGARVMPTMDSIMQLNHDNFQYDPIDVPYNVEDSLRPPTFMVAEADGGNSNNTTGSYQTLDCGLGGDLEDNNIYWNNILNVETSTLGF